MPFYRIILDTETTGLDPFVNHIHQIAGKVLDKDDIVIETFNIKFRPRELNFSPEAEEKLKEGGESLASLGSRPMSEKDGFDAFRAILSRYVNRYDKRDKFFVFGWNVDFDCNMVRAWFTKMGDNYYGSWFFRPLDLMSWFAWQCFITNKKTPGLEFPRWPASFRLGEVAKKMGITVDGNLHEAGADVEITHEIYKRLVK